MWAMKLYKRRVKILMGVVAQLTLFVSCQDLSYHTSTEMVVATVGKEKLLAEEVISAIPKGADKSDSLTFVKLYTERWIKRQTKLREAERLFSSSAGDIEAMVEEYRQSLLTRRLDQYYISATEEPPFSNDDITKYYKENSTNLKLTSPIVKGRLMRLPKGHASETKLVAMMKSKEESSRQDLISSSEKLDDCLLEDFGATWVDYSEFMAMLPIVRDKNYLSYISRKGVQTIHSDDCSYYFDISEYRVAGGVAPLEMVQSTIQDILITMRNQEIIRHQEQELYLNAVKEGVIHDYTVGIKRE